ncbi:MAG: hypothetical protein NZ866_03080 [Patescibacteria group bacterium]|nr:hypothetical protein [Patescibacteria group bacterium]
MKYYFQKLNCNHIHVWNSETGEYVDTISVFDVLSEEETDKDYLIALREEFLKEKDILEAIEQLNSLVEEK